MCLIFIESSKIAVIIEISTAIKIFTLNSNKIIQHEKKNEKDPSNVLLLIKYIEPYLIPIIAANVSDMLIIINDGIDILASKI